MCGRCEGIDSAEDIQEMREILEEVNRRHHGTEALAAMSTGEIRPTNIVPVVAADGPQLMKWGFLMPGSSKAIINAKSETVYEKPMFRTAVLTRRVVVPTLGFYEWSHDEKGRSLDKFLFRLPNDKVLWLAGMYTDFNLPTGRERRYTILTTAANESMQPYHNRMPAIVPANERDVWIHDPGSVEDILYRRQPELVAMKVPKSGQLSFLS